MGYILELRGGHIADVVDGLQHGSGDDDPDGAGVRERLAAVARGDDEVTAEPDAALYVVDVIKQNSHWWSAIQHTSSGGRDFRTTLTDTVAPHLGRDFTVNLINRPIAGVTSDDHPLFGWVSSDEARKALDRARTRGLTADDDQSDELRTIVRMVEGAVEHDLDLLTVYI